MFFFAIPLFVYSQIDSTLTKEKKIAITIGILQGGGGIVGIDAEFLINKNIGLQFGLGYFTFGGAINYHLKSKIRSSFVSINYWHQGLGDGHVQSIIGSTFVYRMKKILSAQIGLGIPVDKGPAIKKVPNYEQPPILLLYPIGAYFPFG